MNKRMMWVSILAVSVMLATAACQSKDVEQGDTNNIVTTQSESHTHEGEDGHNHSHDGEDAHNHSHDEEDGNNHAHEGEDGHNHSHDGEDAHNHSHDEEDGHNHSHDEEDGHNHAHDEEAKQIYAGYFEDSQIENRDLSDWAGDWQSVYPYLLDGTLDEVFEHKAEHGDSKTAAEYKQYYEIGYKTTVDRIVIEGNQVTFYDGEKVSTGEYVSDGYEVLTYEKGNRGVRYIFKLAEPTEGVPTYIQFSDHSISPTDAGHYHLYWGDDRAALLEEVVNWPTYYPSSMDGHTIAHEMIAH